MADDDLTPAVIEGFAALREMALEHQSAMHRLTSRVEQLIELLERDRETLGARVVEHEGRINRLEQRGAA